MCERRVAEGGSLCELVNNLTLCDLYFMCVSLATTCCYMSLLVIICYILLSIGHFHLKLTAVICHRLLLTATTCSQLPLPAFNCHYLLSTATTCSQLPLPASNCRYLLSTATTCSQLPLPALNCRYLLSTATTCSQLPLPALICHQLPGSR